MEIKFIPSDIFGFVKPYVDVHTMGIYTIANLLRDCGLKVLMADDTINHALENISLLNNYGVIKKWILSNGITRLGFSYRLDPLDGCDYFLGLYNRLKSDKMLSDDGGPLRQISFAGLPDTCKMIKAKSPGDILTFEGNETPLESLKKYGIPTNLHPKFLTENQDYDNLRWEFARNIVENESWKFQRPQDHFGYKECGTDQDSYIARLNYAINRNSLPIIRTHSGPYSSNREECLKEYNAWCRDLASSHLLDVLSIGSSQLTQSHFGEKWDGMPNGGGIPVNSELEYRVIKENAIPMLVRTYSGTKNVPYLAKVHERSLNISWHALSFWWFNELDGRGKNTLIENLKEHFETIRYIVTTGKPVEPNVPHHFAFRGADDVTYVISGYLAAKACKKLGVKHLILQNMLNTPKYTWGIQDLAKGRVLINLVRELQEPGFHVSLQSRAGLDYFAPDLENAKIQLAAVTCMMDDLEPWNNNSPEIIHVVNYSEAVRLATPKIIKESIQITLSALKEWRLARKLGKIPDMTNDREVNERYSSLYAECKEAILFLEKNIPNLYSPEGFELIFKEGFLPVPYLMDSMHKWEKATKWKTAIKDGGIKVVDDLGNIIPTIQRYHRIIDNINI